MTSDIVLRRMIGSALILLFVHQVGALVAGAANAALGGLTALLVAGVTFYSARRASAGPGSWAWFLVPALLFTIVPIAYRVWRLFSVDTGLLHWIVELSPLLIGFLAPVMLLGLAYAELHKRTVIVRSPATGRGP